MQVIAAQWAAVGINAEITTVDLATLMTVAGTTDYDIMAVQYTYAPVDPYPDVSWLLGGEGSCTHSLTTYTTGMLRNNKQII